MSENLLQQIEENCPEQFQKKFAYFDMYIIVPKFIRYDFKNM